MIAIKRSRLAVVTVSLSAALALSACGPANEQAAPTPEDAAAASDLHHDHDMSGKDLAMNDDITHSEPTTPMYQEYNDSMTQMHSEMMIGMAYNDPDSAFAQGMLGHHLGAVDMAKIQLKYGKDPEMLQLAQEIIDAQETEIEQMQNWLNSHPDVAAPMADTAAMQQAYATGMNDMHGEMTLGITDPNPDMAFARGMLPHHKGAVDMAAVQLEYGKDPEMLQLAQEIIDAQEAEIEQMQNWIKANGGKVPSA
ncbi:CopM family metallochaperone [Psychrobacter sp. 1U2]|uniref:CopM family metallochaperone n=1 Tax=Psychrobacter sp. 1U2 TaxID=3453577 RepID=UPI003F4788DD